MKRTRFELLPDGNGRWKVTRDRVVLDRFDLKYLALAYAVKRARAAWAKGTPGELLIKGRTGVIQDARSYGRDPRSSKG